MKQFTIQSLVIDEFLVQDRTKLKSRSQVRRIKNQGNYYNDLLASKTKMYGQSLYCLPPKTPQVLIKKKLYTEQEHQISLFKELQYKNLYESEFKIVSEKPRQQQVAKIIQLFHYYQPMSTLRRVLAEDIIFFKKQFSENSVQPRDQMQRNLSIVRQHDEMIKIMSQKAIQFKIKNSILGDKDDLYHLMYLKWIKNITTHNETAITTIRQAVIAAIFTVHQWNPYRNRQMKKQAIEWDFQFSD
ncbi:hypothetical protein SS50377_27238 [Spironucleus salmonicida]|uniref:Uncharacterized protein n=1 Tax=Spironucleus salmonicida TaxID=348837 RepID=V6LJ13_9EUKA|nr:hypothetical protein SS50377_27238 [Spironucleus salmonicida]|eukprot:EST44333.1 Hypothetical protein SS50377_15872 [Spironucleus salmonicida]